MTIEHLAHCKCKHISNGIRYGNTSFQMQKSLFLDTQNDLTLRCEEGHLFAKLIRYGVWTSKKIVKVPVHYIPGAKNFQCLSTKMAAFKKFSCLGVLSKTDELVPFTILNGKLDATKQTKKTIFTYKDYFLH